MAYTHRGHRLSLYITCEGDNAYDEELRGMMREVINHFKGFHDVFRVNERNATCSRAIINTCLYEWSMLALRIQYVYLFILHFPADAPNKSPQIKFVHKEFVAKVKLLYRQIPWYGCVRCDTPFDKPQIWKKNPVVKCLAEVHMAAYNLVAQHVGIPSECKCPPGNYHFQEESEDAVEDEQAAAEE